MDRRDFLKAVGIASGTLLAKTTGLKAENRASEVEMKGVLVDTTVCMGCQSCEEACAMQNNLPDPDLDADVFDPKRKPSTTQFAVIKGYETEKGEIYVKRQCMHCVQPACATACLTKAMYKNPEGPVIWRDNKCMGCRYCMVACPFGIPQFEYDKPIPRIQKCSMCWERLKEGIQPACVENCPSGALMFGTRSELLEEARKRIYNNPDDYVHHIYGEHEVGGTGWLYLSAVPFGQIGFPTNLENTPPAEHTKNFLYSVPVVETLMPAFLLALYKTTKSPEESTEGED
ncbi:MAG: 4Fe-4S dicluster domain-containing protein [Calditrichia bacterium]